MMALILVVDDDPVQRRLLREFFATKHCLSIEAADGASGVMMAEKHRPHLIIMDAMMPSMYGTSATKKLQELTQTASIPIIIRSGFSEEALKKNLPESAGVRYVAKEKPLSELWEKIRELLPEGGYTP